MTDINFSSIAVGSNIPANYQGFNWALCQFNGSFSGPVGISDSDNVHVIQGFGFQIVKSSSGYFAASSITASGQFGMPLDFTAVGYKDGNEIYRTPLYSINPDTFSLPSNPIDTLDISSNAVEVFNISAISVVVPQ